MASYRILLTPGDGIGPEVIAESLKVLEVVQKRFKHEFQYDVFARGANPDRKLLQNETVDGVNWTGWNTLADFELGAGPAAASWAAGRIDLFAVGLDNKLHYRWFDGGIWQP